MLKGEVALSVSQLLCCKISCRAHVPNKHTPPRLLFGCCLAALMAMRNAFWELAGRLESWSLSSRMRLTWDCSGPKRFWKVMWSGVAGMG